MVRRERSSNLTQLFMVTEQTLITFMPNSEAHRCRVCGLLLEEPPWGLDGRTPLFNFCPCCGVEFGYQDATPLGARRFREAWLASGAQWEDPQLRPAIWDVLEQLRNVPKDFE